MGVFLRGATGRAAAGTTSHLGKHIMRSTNVLTAGLLLSLAWPAFAYAQAGPKTRPASGPATDAATAKVAQALDRVLPEVRFDGVGLADVIDFLRDVSGLNLFPLWPAIEGAGIDRNAPVTFSAKKVKARDALARLLTSVKGGKVPLTFAVEENMVVIGPQPTIVARAAANKAFAARLAALDPASRTALERRVPEVRFDDVGLADTFDFLRDVSGVPLDVQWAELERAGVDRNAPVSFKVADLSLGSVLRLLPAGNAEGGSLDIRAKNGRIEIGARTDAKR